MINTNYTQVLKILILNHSNLYQTQCLGGGCGTGSSAAHGLQGVPRPWGRAMHFKSRSLNCSISIQFIHLMCVFILFYTYNFEYTYIYIFLCVCIYIYIRRSDVYEMNISIRFRYTDKERRARAAKRPSCSGSDLCDWSVICWPDFRVRRTFIAMFQD